MTIRHQTRRIRIAASLALVAFAGTTALTGCSSGEPARKLAAEDSPLYKRLGPLLGPTGDEAMREQTRAVEALIAQCMKDQGFEYVPTDSARTPTPDSAERETEKWVAEHGYGITESPSDAEAGADPNEEYVASLSEAESAAYNEALMGRQLDEEAPDGTQDPEAGGCANTAYLEVQTAGRFWEDEKFADLFDAMGELGTKTEKAPEVKAADASWAACMADAGRGDLKKQSDALNGFLDKYRAVVESEDGPRAGGDAAPADLTALHEEEVELALADFRCVTKVGYTDIQRKVQFALEEKFVASHKAELDDLIETYGTAK